jgi:hypothetical protein
VVALVEQVQRRSAVDPLADRLRDLGFVEGEPVRVVALGPIPSWSRLVPPVSRCAMARRRGWWLRNRRRPLERNG